MVVCNYKSKNVGALHSKNLFDLHISFYSLGSYEQEIILLTVASNMDFSANLHQVSNLETSHYSDFGVEIRKGGKSKHF